MGTHPPARYLFISYLSVRGIRSYVLYYYAQRSAGGDSSPRRWDDRSSPIRIKGNRILIVFELCADSYVTVECIIINDAKSVARLFPSKSFTFPIFLNRFKKGRFSVKKTKTKQNKNKPSKIYYRILFPLEYVTPLTCHTLECFRMTVSPNFSSVVYDKEF